MTVTKFGVSWLAAAAAIVFSNGATAPAEAGGTVVVGATASVVSHNPYADSQSMPYAVWCQMYGCLGTYDFKTGSYTGMLVESWEVDKNDPRIWIFHVRKGLKRHGDGKELTAEDIVHSINRIRNDPASKQTQNVSRIATVEAVDNYTVRLVTKKPTAPLLEYLFDRVIITGKDLYEKHGAAKADREYPWGWGPYKLKELKIGQRIVLEKYVEHSATKPENPDTLIFRIMREPEQRITALLNGEIQIAQYVPPHMAKRIEARPNTKLGRASSNRIIFLAMNPNHEPWDDVSLRKAVCHAIDRESIIKHVLNGYAERLDGPIGPGQYSYNGKFAEQNLRIPYDPEKSRALVAQSSYKGEPVVLTTTVSRFINDKQVTTAMIPMLNAVGIKAQLSAPDFTAMWPRVQKGKVPFFYIGRGSVVDPTAVMSQYFETGGSPRIGISDPAIDSALATERVTFDAAERKKALNAAAKAIVDASPACFLWRHQVLTGLASNIDYDPEPSNRIFGVDIEVRQ